MPAAFAFWAMRCPIKVAAAILLPWKTIADAPLLPAWKRWQELEYRRAKIFAHRDAHLYDAPTADAHSTGQFWRAYGQRAGCEFAFYPSRPYFFFVSFRITFSLA